MRGTAPALSALAAATLLGEAPGPAGWLAIALISGGILLLTGEAWRGGSFLWRTAGFSLLNAAVIALYTLVDGVGARLSGAPASYTGGMILGTALGLLAIQLRRGHPGTVRYLRTHWLRGLLGGVCTLTAYTLALWAMTQAPIALVAALRETSVVFALFIATLLLRERWTVLRTLAALTVAAGGIILKLF
jgi:drug/metabolite transporter (DMT)-like permease